MIRRYDEVISQKATKLSLIEVEKKAYHKFARKDDVFDIKQEHESRLDSQLASIEKLDKMLAFLNSNLSKEIYSAVRKVSKQMEATAAKRKMPVKHSFPLQQASAASIQTLNQKNALESLFDRTPNESEQPASASTGERMLTSQPQSDPDDVC